MLPKARASGLFYLDSRIVSAHDRTLHSDVTQHGCSDTHPQAISTAR